MTTPSAPRPNFYAILGLSPSDPWDEALFDRVLREKRNLWSRQRNGIKTADTTSAAQRNLGYVSEIQHVMRSPQRREAERLAALADGEDRLHLRRAEIAEQLPIMLEKGYLTEEEYARLAGEEAVRADDSLRQRLESAERRPGSPPPGDDGRLAEQKWLTLQKYLGMVGQPDLYAVLRTVVPEVSEATPAQKLLEAADDLARKARNAADKSRPEVGAMQNLAGLALQIFGSADERGRHDTSMRLRALDRLVRTYESSMEIARAISSAQFERFLADAAQQGIDLGVARDDLIARLRRRGWTIEMPSAATEDRLRSQARCPRCSRLNDPVADHCFYCGHALRGQCPGCGAAVSGDPYACPDCGFPVGEEDYVSYLVDEAEACLARNDTARATRQATEAGQLWPAPQDRPDALAGRIRAVREGIEGARAARQAVFEQADPLMEARNYRAAARLLRVAVVTHPDMAGPLEECEDAIRNSDQCCREARAPGLPDEQRAEIYDEALRLCADNDDARRELSRLRLSPGTLGPLSAQGYPPAKVMGIHEVELDWPPAERGVVKIACTGPNGPSPRVGDEFPEADLGRYRVVTRGTRDGWFFRTDVLRRYTLVLVMFGRCYVGDTRWYAREPEVEDLCAGHLGTSVRATWTWPREADEALVAWDETPIGDPVNSRARAFVPRPAGAVAGSHDIQAAGRLFVKVAIVVRHQGAAYVTSGVQADAQPPAIAVQDEVKQARGRKGRLRGR